jgi:hypothetical protein
MGRPRTLSDEQRRERKLAYMRDYYRAHKYERRLYACEDNPVNRADAAYDPLRDGPVQRASLTAEICGDPPIGRSALDRR